MKKKRGRRKVKFLDVVIVAIFVAIIIFTYQMDRSFKNTGGVEQTTLIGCVFGLATAELAFCWRIKVAKKEGKTDEDALEEAVKKTCPEEEETTDEDGATCEEMGLTEEEGGTVG